MPTPQQVIIGGALVIANEAKSLAEDSDITYSFHTAEKKSYGDDERPEGCSTCSVKTKQARLPRIVFRNLLSRGFDAVAFWRKKKTNWHLVRVRLSGRWEYNGCDIAGATFYFGSSTAKLGWSVNVEAEVLSSMVTKPSGCEACCEAGVALPWKVEVKIDPPLQSPRIYTAFPYMYADGSYSGFSYT